MRLSRPELECEVDVSHAQSKNLGATTSRSGPVLAKKPPRETSLAMPFIFVPINLDMGGRGSGWDSMEWSL